MSNFWCVFYVLLQKKKLKPKKAKFLVCFLRFCYQNREALTLSGKDLAILGSTAQSRGHLLGQGRGVQPGQVTLGLHQQPPERKEKVGPINSSIVWI